MPENYRALTRTYRPQTFDDIVSQEHVSSTLKNAIKQDRISHAYMFCGPRGVGKTTMARVLARTINSIDAGVDGESLNQTMNVVEIDAASNNKVDDIHHLRESVRIPPQNGRYKVFIIDEVHMLSKAAFNALLKTLEEPPAHAIFIFATTEPHKVLPTILSRVQRFDFKRISVDEIVERLKAICTKEGITIDEESLHVIAKKADGALRDALGLMDQAIAFCGDDIHHNELIEALNVVGIDQLFTFISAVEKKDSSAGLQLVDDLMKAGVDIQEFLSALTEHLRNLYVAVNSGRMHLVDATADTKLRYKEAAKAFEEEDLMRMLHLVSDAQMKIRDVQQPRVHFEILLLKLIHMNRSRELSSLLEDLNQLKKNGGIQLAPDSSTQEVESKTKSNSEDSGTDSKPETTNSSPKAEKTQVKPKSKSIVEEPSGSNGSANSVPLMREDTSEQPASSQQKKPSGTDAELNSDDKPGKQKQAPDRETEIAEESRVTSTSADEADENDDYDFLIKPTLGYAKGISSPQGVVDQKADVDIAVKQTYPEPASLDTLDDLELHWRSFVNKVKDEAPRMLYMQVLRVSLKDLNGNELIVAADTEFAINLFDENQQLLSELMKRTVGVRVRLKCIVERNEKKKETKSPYERFKELQKKDPHLKTVVDLFGAELDY